MTPMEIRALIPQLQILSLHHSEQGRMLLKRASELLEEYAAWLENHLER